jgi:hypothetical protein
MNSFQLFGISIVGILVVFTVANIFRYRGRTRTSVLWLLVWVVTGAVLLKPSLAVGIARMMGIGRGADLVFYVNVLITLGGFFIVYLRHRRYERQITLLVREIALLRPSRMSNPENR